MTHIHHKFATFMLQSLSFFFVSSFIPWTFILSKQWSLLSFFSFLGIYLVSGIFYLLCTFLPPLGTNGFDSMLKVSAASFHTLTYSRKKKERGWRLKTKSKPQTFSQKLFSPHLYLCFSSEFLVYLTDLLHQIIHQRQNSFVQFFFCLLHMCYFDFFSTYPYQGVSNKVQNLVMN